MNSDRDVSDTFRGACHNGDVPRFFALFQTAGKSIVGVECFFELD
tara:strand:- start:21673 stop:21807 length:135 start_codon:yes stop_codon:yes gene_type:complete